jgi:hypothetical protein
MAHRSNLSEAGFPHDPATDQYTAFFAPKTVMAGTGSGDPSGLSRAENCDLGQTATCLHEV